MKESLQTLVNMHTAPELAEQIEKLKRELEYKDEEIEKLKIALKYYKSAANLFNEVSNLATEKRHGDIRQSKFVKDGAE